MMKLSCKDISPDTDCNFVAKGEDEAEVSKKMLAHVKEKHEDDIKGMTDGEVLSMFEDKVHE